MDAKVKAMIKLIEEDADSFARRAEMYYKRRPELMKLVEEFYRAYRALAERYNHATVELRQAHRTMAEAFPDQVPDELAEDSASTSSGGEVDPHTPESSHPRRASFEMYDSNRDASSLSSNNASGVKRHGAYSESSGSTSCISKKGLKQVHEIFESDEVTSQYRPADGITSRGLNLPEILQNGLSQLSSENQNLKIQVASESERASRAEIEVQTLKKILAEIQAEKDSMLSQYEQILEQISNLKRDLDHAQENARGLDDRASKADIEIKILKEALEKLEAERDASLAQYNQSLRKISSLEMQLFRAEEDSKGLSERAISAETETQNLKHELSRLEAEKEAGLLQYRQCLETISVLESKISLAEMDAGKLSEQVANAEAEIQKLEHAVVKSNEEKEAVAFLYKQCLETLARMESELSRAQDDARRLNSEVAIGAEKLKNAEEQRLLLEKSNQSLQSDAENLSQKVAMKDQELSRKHEELRKIQEQMQDDRLQFVHVQASLETLQKLHYESHKEQRDLALEIKSGLQMLKDLETCKYGLEEEITKVKEENRSLTELNTSSTISEKNLKNELYSLKEMKEKLEQDFTTQLAQSTALQQEIFQLREEIKGLNGCYKALLSQVELVGLDPLCFGQTVKELQSKNSELKEIQKRDRDEREVLYEKLKNMDKISEKNVVLEISLSQLNIALEESKEKIKLSQENCQSLQGEKCSLVADKAALLSQLQIITENMQKLLEKNSSLESSISAARAEAESLREKSKRIDEFCQLLINEKSSLVNERSNLALHLDNVEQRLGSLERRFDNLEKKCDRLEKEKETTLCQVEELKGYLGVEKQERATYVQSSEARLAGLENHVHFLQDEIQLRKKEFEEEVEKAVNAQVEIFILQKFVEDLEAKNLSLLLECQKHAEASKLSNKLINELESENLEQQVEGEMLADEIGRLKTEIYQVFKALQIDAEVGREGEIAKQQIPSQLDRLPFVHIMDRIGQLKKSLTRSKDEEQKLLVENTVLVAFLRGLGLECNELESSKDFLKQELGIMTEQCMMQEKDKHELLEMKNLLKLDLGKAEQQQEALETDLKVMHKKLVDVQMAYQLLQEDNSNRQVENQALLEKITDSEAQKHALEEENSVIIQELNSLGNLSLVFQSFGKEKAEELKALAADLCGLQTINNDLRGEIEVLREKLETERAEKSLLVDSIEKLDREFNEVRDFNDQINHQILIGNDFLREKAKELSEVDQKLELSQFSVIELSRTVEELKRKHEESRVGRENVEKQIHELSEIRKRQEEQIESLLEVKQNLELKVNTLQNEIEERRIREENLSSELQERSNEFELWEAEAATFYFDLQISSVREVLLENKVQELSQVCQSLRDESAMKNGDIEQMKEKLGFLESEVGGLKNELSAYVPILSSLRDGMTSLKPQSNFWKHQHAEKAYPFPENGHAKFLEEQSFTVPAVSDLQKMQDRIEAVEKAVREEMGRVGMEKSQDALVNLENDSPEREEFHKEKIVVGNDISNDQKPTESKCEIPPSQTGQLMKDIPLDQASDSLLNEISSRDEERPNNQMLEDAWKNSLNPSSELEIEKELGIDKVSASRELGKERSKKKILDRLASDAQKLTGLQASVQDMRRKAELKKSKRSHKVKYETVKRQLEEVEESVMHLMVMNDHLVKDIDVNLSSLDQTDEVEMEDIESVREQKIREQAKKESEKIGRLQFEVQNINYILLKMEDEKKGKGKSRFSRSSTGIILKDFIYIGSRNGERQKKKACFCGCRRPNADE